MNTNARHSGSGRRCPHCGSDIGMFASVKAPLPNLMKCGSCKAKIAYIGNYWLEYLACSALFAVIIISLTYLSFPVASTAGVSMQAFLMAYIVACVLLWLVIGSLLSVYLMRKKVLVVRKGK